MPRLLQFQRRLQPGVDTETEIVAGDDDAVTFVEEREGFRVGLGRDAEDGEVGEGAGDVRAEFEDEVVREEVGVDLEAEFGGEGVQEGTRWWGLGCGSRHLREERGKLRVDGLRDMFVSYTQFEFGSCEAKVEVEVKL